jgi:hypothetical protein
MDFFTVPTVTLRVLHCFFVIEHERRKVLRCNVTQFPTACSATAGGIFGAVRYQYAILDRDRKFDTEVVAFLTASGLKAKVVSVDFFAVPTVRFQMLYVFLVLAHDPAPNSAFRRDGTSDRGMDGATTAGGISWDSAPGFFTARPRPHLRC